MGWPELSRLVPDAGEELLVILDPRRGPLEAPIRAEIFGPERFAQHGQSLAATHRAKAFASHAAAFFPRLRDNIRTLREAHHYIALQAKSGYYVSPAAEWLLDNFYLIDGQLTEIRDGLPRRYFRDLPLLIDPPLAGLPRIYGVAWAFVAHTDGAFDEELLARFLGAYQEVRELTLGELWALPTTLRVVLVENLRRLAERVAANKAARELAYLVGDRIESYSVARLDELLALVRRRGVGETFLVQVAQGLQDQRAPGLVPYREWLQHEVPDLAAVQIQHPAEQAADNLSVSNAIGSLRLIGNADWAGIIARTNAAIQLLLTIPVFAAERDDTRAQTLHAIERLARKSGRSERVVAQTLLDLIHRVGAVDVDGEETAEVPSYWLRGPGRRELTRLLGIDERAAALWRAFYRHAALPAYLGTIAASTFGLSAWTLMHHSAARPRGNLPLWLSLLTAALMLFPASEAVVAVINRLISESLRPRRLPRLLLAGGIPAEHRVIVVIPGMLNSASDAETLTHRLLLHYLANQERHAQFALLTDWADADQATLPTDAGLLDTAARRIGELNARYPVDAGGAPRFIVLHRARQWSPTERRWIGWERKRGKLEQLIGVLAPSTEKERVVSPFIDLGLASQIGEDIKYVVTLDGDTELPPGRLRELVGVASHPENQPQVDPSTRIVVRGYGILQPRVVTPLPAAKDVTPFHWLFAGQPGIDPYSAATSEVYQDVFGEGTFTGKGLLNVAALHAVLTERLPEGQVLSHDLLEGSLARCAAVTDITVIEEAPFHADVAASRVHRWTRGDWQLLPFMLGPSARGMRAINLWKMLDNLRRSLVAPMSLGLVVLALASDVVTPMAALALVFAAYAAGPLLGAVAGFAPSRDDVAIRYFYRQALGDLARAVCTGLWVLAQQVQLALMSADAVVRALYRTAISRRHLLQWTTAASVQASASGDFATLARKHWIEPAIALMLLIVLNRADAPAPDLAFVLCVLWAASPVSTWLISRPLPVRHDGAPNLRDRAYLQGVARDTWRLFERCVGAGDNHLPPDNLQVAPNIEVAHRTSPTNIGLYLLSVACARRFGWIGTEDLLARLEATLQTLGELQRHRGHFLNWYDTQSKAPLLPMYVSTVDSGNLSAYLLAVAEACIGLARAPYDCHAAQDALKASRSRIESRRSEPQQAAATPANPSGALAYVLALTNPLAECRDRPDKIEALLRDATVALADLLPVDDAPLADGDAQVWRISDHLAHLRSALRDIRAEQAVAADSGADAGARRRLNAVAAACQRLAWEADFTFLYEGRRHLFHIGYRVAEQQQDAGYYDLLASEAHLTSLLAIAKGDVPVNHWAALGRPFFAVGTHAGLRSWSGSMFEYLLPSLTLDEPQGSVLRNACRAALFEQIAYGRAHRVPWGVSESAYAGRDHTLAYQYAAQGVPRLALRRTPQDELVIAPYATALAAQFAPHRAATNLARLERRGARGRYGFIEALDFTPARQSADEGYTRVATFMAHHQAMSIVALANTLLDRAPRRWGMAEPHIEAVASLLHERAPRELPLLPAPPPSPSPDAPKHRSVGLLREVIPGVAAVTPTHLLSNGRYSVALRANGAGWSRWGHVDITRWRDDLLRDAYGSFFYLRWDRQPQAVSLTQHPAPDSAASYESSYHADRIAFDAHWSALDSRVTVWVSPEDDIEFRRVELSNHGERTLDLELISAFEVTLAERGADEAHPAFSNLFVRAYWRAAHDALLLERTPRLPAEHGLYAAHFLAESDTRVSAIKVETDRAKWLGRNRDASQPLAAFDGPAPVAKDSVDSIQLDTGLDPMAALSVRVRVAPHSKVRLTFCTAASDNQAALAAVIDKYRQHGPMERSSMMSATLSGIRLRELRMGADSFVAIQTLTTALVQSVTRGDVIDREVGGSSGYSHGNESQVSAACDRRLLWRFRISGDRPIILVSAGTAQAIGLVRTLAQALRVWSWGGVACDLVVINAEPRSYVMGLQHDLAALRERYIAESGAQPGSRTAAGFEVVHEDELSADEQSTLLCLARIHLEADGRPLTHHVQEWSELHDEALARRDAADSIAVPMRRGASASMRVAQGTFAPQGGEFQFDVSASLRPLRPWVNVLANPDFGAQLSEAGGGYTWAANSRLNQLTPWSNDPISDAPAEWFLLQDVRSRDVWSIAPSAWGDPVASYRVVHGQGYSMINHRRGDLDVEASWCVDPQKAVKQIRLRLTNRGQRHLSVRAVGIVEWQMGANRSDRMSIDTTPFRRDFTAAPLEPGRAKERGAEGMRTLSAVLCSQRERAAGFGGSTAFLAIVDGAGRPGDWTCDRRECFDARGRLVVPDRFGQRSGAGLDPCAAIATQFRVAAGESIECVFLLGYGASPAEARKVAVDAAAASAQQRSDEARAKWNELLDAITVRTPDPLFDVMVNRWLPYQTLACRLWARAGFYQAGGAFGFRDQLQDAMALAWTAPALLRQQIVLCASRQFVEGDVQHWWHPPDGAGVRTHFSDDLLWLPYACRHYLRCSGDTGLLDEPVPFLAGPAIAEGAEDAYFVPTVSGETATVFEHCARTIDRSLNVGTHGLPLMGTGDWNDGMNRVGYEGRGESVWLAWFLCLLVADFAPLARGRGEEARALRWEDAARGWTKALQDQAWDGQWYKRAFFDDGTPLGSQANTECRIDLIAQAWAVISNAAPPVFQRNALAAMDVHLVDREAGLIKLLAPPLFAQEPSAGYIQAYPKGVRENGGQYSHAGVWALIAQAQSGDADTAYRYFTYLSPAHRTREPEKARVYAIEPYVMAGDAYSEPPYVGRGGWSWYTGSAAWLHRAAIEALFGMRQRADAISFEPCLPSHWDQAELTLRRDARTAKVIFARPAAREALAAGSAAKARALGIGEAFHWSELPAQTVFVVALPAPTLDVSPLPRRLPAAAH